MERGLSQRQVAGEQITRNMLSQLENDQASPSVKTLTYLAQRLDVSLSWLIDEEDAACSEAVLQKARWLFLQGEYQACMECLIRLDVLSEEGSLMLCRSAVACGVKALESGSLQEAERAAAGAACCKGAYLCEQDRMAVLSLQCRIALVKGTLQQSDLTLWEKTCSAMEENSGKNWIMTHALLVFGDFQRAEQLISSLNPVTAFDTGYFALLCGWLETEKRDYAQAIASLKLAEENPALGFGYRMEVYRLLERCFRELGDFRMAYHYAVLRLNQT